MTMQERDTRHVKCNNNASRKDGYGKRGLEDNSQRCNVLEDKLLKRNLCYHM